MCWATPGKVIGILEDEVVRVDFGGVVRDVLMGFEDVKEGDLVMVHSGVIIGKITEAELISNLGLFIEAEILGLQDMGYTQQKAREIAVKQFRNLLSSLGINPEIYNYAAQLEPDDKNAEDAQENVEKIKIPEVAYACRYRTSLSDMDYLQVMHYTNYFKYCERSWMEFLSKIGISYSTLIHKFGIFIPTVQVEGKIYAPVRMDNDIEVFVWVEEVGKKHIKYRCVVKNLTSERVAAVITHVAVCTDTSLMESLELPRELINKLSPYIYR